MEALICLSPTTPRLPFPDKFSYEWVNLLSRPTRWTLASMYSGLVEQSPSEDWAMVLKDIPWHPDNEGSKSFENLSSWPNKRSSARISQNHCSIKIPKKNKITISTGRKLHVQDKKLIKSKSNNKYHDAERGIYMLKQMK